MEHLFRVLIIVLFFQIITPAMGQNTQGDTLPSTFFPVLCWDPQHGWNNQHVERLNGLKSIRECNFTIAGMVQNSDIKELEALGLKGFAFGDTDTITLREWNDIWDDTTLTDEIIDEKIRRMVERTGESEAIIGYFICDEPGASMFPRLSKAVESVHKYAPGKIAYINLFPDYATIGAKDLSQLETATYQEHLNRYATEVNPTFISYDNYMVQKGMDMKEEWRAASYYKNLLAVRQTALKYGLPFWNIVSSNQIRPNTTIPSPANLLFQAYTTLAAGGKGVTWYTYYSREYEYAPVNKDGKKTQTWYYLKEVNRQLSLLGPVMNQLETTGVYFSSPAPVDDLPLLPGILIESIEADAPVMVGEFEGRDGEAYAMIVNLSLEKSTLFKITLQNETSMIRMISSADGEPVEFNQEKGYWLVAGQGVLIKL